MNSTEAQDEGLYDLLPMVEAQSLGLYRDRAGASWRQWRAIERTSLYQATRAGLRPHEVLCAFCGDAYRWRGERGLHLCSACK